MDVSDNDNLNESKDPGVGWHLEITSDQTALLLAKVVIRMFDAQLLTWAWTAYHDLGELRDDAS